MGEAARVLVPLVVGYLLKSLQDMLDRRRVDRERRSEENRSAVADLHRACLRLCGNLSVWLTANVPVDARPGVPPADVLRADQELRIEIRSLQVRVADPELVARSHALLDVVADIVLDKSRPAGDLFSAMENASDALDDRVEALLAHRP